ncbi:MAG: sigma-54 factor interaction domain-containing protein [Bacteroidota bacterium]
MLGSGKTDATAIAELNVRSTTELATGMEGFEGIIGKSHLLLNVFDHITQVAPSDTSVLIMGESGTGKERIADCIHNLSPRNGKPFVKVNCAALPLTLIESELFGHEKGSFTGAIEKRIGRFELADKGTIFLDEIGEMPVELQAKLLRVLQEKEIERIGAKAPVKVNVRVITATNRNLEKEVAEGRFSS